MSNLMSSTELLKIGSFWYRLNIIRSKPLNWLPVVRKAKIAEELQLEENCRSPAGFAVYCLHPGLLILCNPD